MASGWIRQARDGTWAASIRHCTPHALPLRPVCPQEVLLSRLLSVFPAQHAELSEYRPIVSEAHQLQHRTSVADKKLVLIPLIFICLRVWSTVRFVLTLCGSPAVRMPVLVALHVGLPAPAWPAPALQPGWLGPAPLRPSPCPAQQGGLTTEGGRSAWLQGRLWVLSCCPMA